MFSQKLGLWGLELMRIGLQSYGAALFARQLKLSEEESVAICDKAYKEFCRRDVHIYTAL